MNSLSAIRKRAQLGLVNANARTHATACGPRTKISRETPLVIAGAIVYPKTSEREYPFCQDNV
jgi:hypothetical protein